MTSIVLFLSTLKCFPVVSIPRHVASNMITHSTCVVHIHTVCNYKAILKGRKNNRLNIDVKNVLRTEKIEFNSRKKKLVKDIKIKLMENEPSQFSKNNLH